jgi:alkanesulfonate monooxygenase SsuD/methylene tetrahydromethanopterin reductase-like flavin-dependent oxidoreductase (luciferase family)
MKFGTFHLLQWHDSKSQAQVFKETVELVKLSEELGFDSVWLADHHFSRYGLGSSVLTIAAHLAAATTTLKIGTAVVVLPFYNPLTVAEVAATVDNLSDGRLILGVGRGYQWSEFHRHNVPFEESRDRFDEALDIILRAWTEDELDYQGKFWHVNGAQVLPKPVQKPHPPIAVATLSPDGFRNAARRHQSVICGGSTGTVAGITQNLALYRESLAGAGYSYDPSSVIISRPVYVGRTREEAKAAGGGERLNWFLDAQRRVALPPSDRWDLVPEKERPVIERLQMRSELTWDDAFNTMGISGSPDECIQQIRELDGIVGGLETLICSFTLGGFDLRQTAASMELFAREVMPRFADAPVASPA